MYPKALTLGFKYPLVDVFFYVLDMGSTLIFIIVLKRNVRYELYNLLMTHKEMMK